MDKETLFNGLECCVAKNIHHDIDACDRCKYDGLKNGPGCDMLPADALAMLKEQEDCIRILSDDLDDLRKEHNRLVDKKIPLITQGLEVTRCKDCKWFGIEYGYTFGWCNKNHIYSIKPDWFCADGERKEGL